MSNNSVLIEHFLNKDVDAISYQSQNYYPLYINIKVNDKNTKIKSRIDDHLKIYKSALELDPKDKGVWNNLGKVYAEKRDNNPGDWIYRF